MIVVTDLGVECVVGLCVAAAIVWIARRRSRNHTEGLKTRLDGSFDPAQELPIADADAVAAAEAVGEAVRRDAADSDANAPSITHNGDDLLDIGLEKEDDDNDETDDENEDVRNEDGEEGDGLATNEGGEPPSMLTESVVAMGEFLVLDGRPPALTIPMSVDDDTDEVTIGEEEVDEGEGSHVLDDPSAAFVQLDASSPNPQREETNNSDAAQEGPLLAEPGPSNAMTAFWARCENKDECHVCGERFSFLSRRHHCRKCCASVCGRCSSNVVALPEFSGSAERVCDHCWASHHLHQE